MSGALSYAAAELITGAVFLLMIVAYDHYKESKRKRGPWDPHTK